MLLAASGALFALVFVVLAFARTFGKQYKTQFGDTLMLFLAALLPLGALVQSQLDQTNGTTDTLTTPSLWVVYGIAALLLVGGLVLIALEFRRPEIGLKGSRGVLGVGAAVLLLVATFSVPFTGAALNPPPTPTATATPQGTPPPPTATATATATATITPSPTSTATVTNTSTPRPTDTPFPTIERLVTRTPSPTVTAANPCVAVVTNNLNLRAEPNRDAAILATIPFNTTVTLFSRDRDSVWFLAEYEGQTGWILGEFLNRSTSCADLQVAS
jgi:hypothetical protein